MIQELYPYKLDNQYRNAVPKAGDRIISIRDHRMLVKEREDGTIDFPKREELGVRFQENGISRYLFSVDDTFKVLEIDGDAALIEKIGDENNPYFVSGCFLESISDYKHKA